MGKQKKYRLTVSPPAAKYIFLLVIILQKDTFSLAVSSSFISEDVEDSVFFI